METNKMSTLRKLIRSKFNSRIKPLFIADCCEECGSTEDLQLHHCCYLCIIVNNILNYLEIEEKETVQDYTEEELYLITSCIMNEHLKVKYKTLCKDCHTKEHSHCVSDPFVGCGSAYFKTTWDLTPKQLEYLDINLNKKRYGKDNIIEIAKILDCRDQYDRLDYSVDGINEWFEKKNLNYYIEFGKEKSREGKKYGCPYYIIRLLNDK